MQFYLSLATTLTWGCSDTTSAEISGELKELAEIDQLKHELETAEGVNLYKCEDDGSMKCLFIIHPVDEKDEPKFIGERKDQELGFADIDWEKYPKFEDLLDVEEVAICKHCHRWSLTSTSDFPTKCTNCDEDMNPLVE